MVAGFSVYEARSRLLAEFAPLHAGTTKQLAMLLLRHALAALLDHRTHRVSSRSLLGASRARLRHLSGRTPGCSRLSTQPWTRRPATTARRQADSSHRSNTARVDVTGPPDGAGNRLHPASK